MVLRRPYSAAELGQRAVGETGFRTKFQRIKDRDVSRSVANHTDYFGNGSLSQETSAQWLRRVDASSPYTLDDGGMSERVTPEADDVYPVLTVGERVTIRSLVLTVTELDATSLPTLRRYLIEVARQGGITTYGVVKSDLALPHVVNGLGRLLDLLGEDCARRAEPSLAALVVAQGTGEVGHDFDGDAESLRRDVYRYWSTGPDDIVDRETEFVLNGVAHRLAASTVRARVLPTPPDPVQTHWVQIDGARWPPKQAFRVATGLHDEPFISHFAIRVFRRLGFETSQMPGEWPATSIDVVDESERRLPSAPAIAAVDPPVSSLTDEDASLAFRRLDAFLSAASLTATLAGLESQLVNANRDAAQALALATGFDEDLVDSALVVRERVGLIDTLIHAAVITQVLPLILKDGETVLKRPSLGAGNDPDRVFDLETTHRVVEFKLSSWKGADGGRQRALFADVVGLSLDDSGRRREVYVVGTIPMTFLMKSKRNAAKTLSKAALRLRTPEGLNNDITVSAFTAAAQVNVVDLTALLPRLR
jgi:hypothetical protein